jgi:hypothetical protein
MNELTEFGRILEAEVTKPERRRKPVKMPESTGIAPDAPAPRLEKMAVNRGSEVTQRALSAYEARMKGSPVVDIAHALGVSIDVCKALLREAHDAVREDLKEALEMNRQLDLGRLDGLIKAYYEPATQGDSDSAYVVLAALKHRAKLTGLEAVSDPLRSKQPNNVMVWLNTALPAIDKIVKELPIE